ncbi:calmodulin-binding transcription activator 5-like [Forsythia ovata]|uniref:Calmodulin-binding transcription activator 5-like n=1 Tax=Forsythia ovata TaxID=205694 RepID=A0ABD1TQP3_9LAMI
MENLKGLAFLKSVKEAFDVVFNGNLEKKKLERLTSHCFQSLEHIVLVHYRETQELQDSPTTPVNSNSGSTVSDPSTHWPLSEESNSAVDRAYYSRSQLENNDGTTIKNHEQRLHEINTLEWDELVVPNTVPGLRSLGGCYFLDNPSKDGLQAQDSFRRWINYIIANSLGSVDDQTSESSISARYQSFTHPINDNHGSSVLGRYST